MNQNQKRIIWFFPVMMFGISAVMLLMRFVKGKPVTLELVLYDLLFTAIFSFVIVSFALLVDYFFGEKIRKNPRPIFIMNAVIFFALAIGNGIRMVRDYMAGKGFDWVVLVMMIFFIGLGYNMCYLARKVGKR